MTTPLPQSFYAQSALTVARELLGAQLVRILPDGTRISGRIVETEAYSGLDDLASHGHSRRTPRNTVMYGPPGHAYVYFTYGNWWMPNVVAEPEDTPAAVLIRALEPLDGLDEMARRRTGRPPEEWTNGPAKLAVALDIGKELNGVDLTTHENGLWIEPDITIPEELVRTGPRIGMGKTPEPWYSMPWRWWVGGNLYVSKGSGKKG
ncbi:MAG: DNA-3-methyladenine glycosylase [Chloroflexota bacterium]